MPHRTLQRVGILDKPTSPSLEDVPEVAELLSDSAFAARLDELAGHGDRRGPPPS